MRQLITVVVIATQISGCARKPEPPPVRDFELAVGGMELPERSQLTVRDNEIIKVYHTGRRIDPANPNIMHEAGHIYVVKRSPAWNTRPNVPVLSADFKERLNVTGNTDIDISQSNIQHQTKLLQKSNKHLARLSAQIKASRERLEKLSQTAAGSNDTAELDRLRRDQEQIIKKLAELEAKK
jgi:hypothetical protein